MKLTPERRWVLVFATLVMVVTTIPYVLAYAGQGPDQRFTGALVGVEDGNSYIAKMLDGSAGAWLFRTPYTTFSQNGLLAFFPYLLLGKLAVSPGLHEQLVALFQLFRIAAGILSILAAYDFLSLFVKRESNRRIGTALAAAGGGLGWILIVFGLSDWLGSLPLEIYSPESFGFLELYSLPHLALARACLLWGLVYYLRSSTSIPGASWKRNPIIGGLFFLIAGFSQPLTALVGWVVLATHLAVTAVWEFARRRRPEGRDWSEWAGWLRCALGMVLVSSPIILYTVYASLTDPFLRAWTAQNILPSPHPLHYLVAYGLFIPFGLVATVHWLRSQPKQGLFLVGWILIFPFLAYAPVSVQRRLPEGIYLVWIALALGFFEVTPSAVESRLRRVFALAAPTTLIVFLAGCLVGVNPQFPLYLPTQEINAFDYLGENAAPESVVLAAYDTANALPAWANVRVIVGHGPESIAKPELLQRLAFFYQGTSPDSDRKAFLKEYNVLYVFWGPFERRLGDWNPNQAGYLKEVYNQNRYVIYQVNAESTQ